MNERTFETPCGKIHYWVNDIRADRQSLKLIQSAGHNSNTDQPEPREWTD